MTEVFRFESFVTCTFNQRGRTFVRVTSAPDWISSTLSLSSLPTSQMHLDTSQYAGLPAAAASYFITEVTAAAAASSKSRLCCGDNVSYGQNPGMIDTLVHSNLGCCSQMQTRTFFFPTLLWPPGRGSESSCVLKGLSMPRLQVPCSTLFYLFVFSAANAFQFMQFK